MQAFANAAAGPIDPPAHLRLRDADRPFWVAIVGARARDKWDDVDLAHAANLARTQATIEELQQVLEAEGHVITNNKGTPIANPVHSVLETLSRRAVALSRMLHVHPEAKVGESREQGKKLGKQREAERSLEAGQVDGDDVSLLGGVNGPTH